MNRPRNTTDNGALGNMGGYNVNEGRGNGMNDSADNMDGNRGMNDRGGNMNGDRGMYDRGGNMNGDRGGMGGNGSGLGKEALFEQIRALGFVKVELELYLDTHPNCRTAIDYYFQTVAALERLTDEYEARFGPLTAAGVTTSESWSWVDSPWPWHRADERMPNEWAGKGN